jgi:hypothetical protein
MPSYKKKPDFFVTDAGNKAKADLEAMQANQAFNTPNTYTANTDRYPENNMSFAEKHMDYLKSHPNTNPDQYIANLRLITRRKVNS